MHSSIFETWGEKAADNAASLAAESRLLFEAKYLPRAYYLAHMSTEESAKSILLRTMSTLGTPESELPKISKLFRNHKKKIEFLVTHAATLSEDVKTRLGNLEGNLIDHINNLKNDTMYVSYEEKSVVTPMEKVAAVEIELYVNLAETLSQYAKSFLTPPSSAQPLAAAHVER